MATSTPRPVRRASPACLLLALGSWMLAVPAPGTRGGMPATARPAQSAAGSDAGGARAAVVSRISESRLRQVVRDLVALGPRMGGTPSGHRAAAFVADAFRSYGFDVGVSEDTPVQAWWADRWHVRLGPAATPLSSAWPELFSPSIEPPSGGRLVPVSGLDTAKDGHPNVVVYTPEFDRAIYARLAGRVPRPLAILTSAPHEPDRYADWASLGHTSLLAREGALPVFALGFKDGVAVADAMRAGHRVDLGLVAHRRRAAPRTVVAELPGSRTGRYYLVTAHGDSDSGGPGADDNASGVAVVLELARVLQDLRRAGRLVLPFSVRFAVWGKEYDSAHDYIVREGASLAACAGVINIDQAGTGAEREALYVEGNDVPWNRALLRAFDDVGREHRGRAGFWPEFATTPTQGGTDAYAFLPRAYKGRDWTRRELPAVTLYTAAWDGLGRVAQTPGWESDPAHPPGTVLIDYSRYYHSSGDVPARTTEREPQNMVRVVTAIGLTLARLR